jgi:hypothetical protein
MPFITTPNYPDYTSGANNLAGSASRILAHFFGTDKVTFSISSANPDAVTPRLYMRFSDAAEDIVNARIYHGINFRFADEVALRQGTHVADWTFSHFLRPVGNDPGIQACGPWQTRVTVVAHPLQPLAPPEQHIQCNR